MKVTEAVGNSTTISLTDQDGYEIGNIFVYQDSQGRVSVDINEYSGGGLPTTEVVRNGQTLRDWSGR